MRKYHNNKLINGCYLDIVDGKQRLNAILSFVNNEFADFYFTHSYRMKNNMDFNQCLCNYQEDFIASFEHDNIAGVQFHPELSQTSGLKLFKNFIDKF